MKYIKAFDSLRAIAVVLVIIWHWLHNKPINKLPNGPFGVTLFFVLSGFLITGILLDGKQYTEQSSLKKGEVIRNFFIRRALRIFPIYYLIIIPFFVYAIAHHQNLTKYLYYITYTSNFYFYQINDFDFYLGHIWTLAVEEQFYFIWPFIIILVPKKFLLPCIMSFIATGFIAQVAFKADEFVMYLPFTCFDSLGMGALLAWVTKYKPLYLKKLSVAAGAIAMLVVVHIYLQMTKITPSVIPVRMQLTIVAFAIITYIVHRSYNNLAIPAYLNFILNNNALVRIGKISYGIYLYHVLVPFATLKVYGKILPLVPPFVKQHFQVIFIVFNFLLLLFVAQVSWKLIEKPILLLKKKFDLKKENSEPLHDLRTVVTE